MAARTLARTALLSIPLALALATGLLAPAQARPWPGHPDRSLVAYVVRPGDTATGLAVRYHAWTRELIALNRLGDGHRLRAGQRITIPVVVSRARAAAHPRPSTAAATPRPRSTAAALYAAGWRHWRMSRAEVSALVARAARAYGVPVRLARAIAWQESGWHQPLVSSAGAIGVMQVLPATGAWMAIFAGRPLNLRNTYDNVLAGVLLLRHLRAETVSDRRAIGAYYQGLGAVRRHGLYPSTRAYVRSVLAIAARL